MLGNRVQEYWVRSWQLCSSFILSMFFVCLFCCVFPEPQLTIFRQESKVFNYFLLVWLVCGYKLYRCIWDHSTNIATCKNTLTCCRIDTVKHYIWDKWLLNASQDKNTMKRSTSVTGKRTLATVRSKMYNSLNRWVLLKSQTNYCHGLKNAFVLFFFSSKASELSSQPFNNLCEVNTVQEHFCLLGSDKWAIKPASIG